MPFGSALERLDVVHRDLGLVVAIGLEVLRRDAELFARDIEDRPLLGGLRDLDVGFRVEVLRGGASVCLGCGALGSRGHESLVPTTKLCIGGKFAGRAFAARRRACTRRTLMRPSAHTTVKPSRRTATISPILPAMPLGSLRRQRLRLEDLQRLAVERRPGAGRRIAAADQTVDLPPGLAPVDAGVVRAAAAFIGRLARRSCLMRGALPAFTRSTASSIASTPIGNRRSK